jgi:hypothetical protein
VSDFALALEHYRLHFPTVESLGVGDPPHLWLEEYKRVAALGLDATLVTTTGADGSSVGAQRNFDQKILLRALHERRAELEINYQPFAPTVPRHGIGVRVRVWP